VTPSFPFTRRQALAAAFVLALLLVVAGRFLVQEGEGPEAIAAESTAAGSTGGVSAEGGSTAPGIVAAEPEPPAQVVVHVVGAVRRPGLYRLDEGSRVADAVALAGGTTPKANLTAVNLAATLVDGTQVVVPRAGDPAAAPASPGGAGAAGQPPGPIRLSTATAEELQTIPGVGPVTAERIIQYREQNGPFRSVEDLDAVPGIGPKRLEQLRDLVVP
jgi:competence protein ComEA